MNKLLRAKRVPNRNPRFKQKAYNIKNTDHLLLSVLSVQEFRALRGEISKIHKTISDRNPMAIFLSIFFDFATSLESIPCRIFSLLVWARSV